MTPCRTHGRRLRAVMLAGVLALAASAPAAAAPPANDTAAGAEVIPAAGPFDHLTSTVSIAEATPTDYHAESPVPSCNTIVSQDLWYTLTPSAAGQYTFTVEKTETATTVSNMVMAVYTSTGGAFGPFTQVGCTNLFSKITVDLAPGTQYWIVVYRNGSGTPITGDVQMRVKKRPPPANDTAAGAIDLPLATALQGNTAAGADDYRLSGATCFGGLGQTATTAADRDVVYRFTPPSDGLYSFRLRGFTPNAALYLASVLPGGPPPATVGTCLAAANRTGSGRDEEVIGATLEGGVPVFVVVDGAAATAGGAFTIEADPTVQELEPNDVPAQASPLAYGTEGRIGAPGEVDYYDLGTPPAGSRLFAMVDGGAAGNVDLTLRVTTATDTLEFDDDDNTAPFGAFSPNVAGTPLNGQHVYLQVASYAATEPYQVYAVIRPPLGSATAEIEPNGTLGQATLGTYVIGALASGANGDADWFSFPASAGGLLFASVDGDPDRDNTPIAPNLELRGSSLPDLAFADDSNTTSATTSGAGSLTATTPRSPGEAVVARVPSAVPAPAAADAPQFDVEYFLGLIYGTNSGKPAGNYTASVVTGKCNPPLSVDAISANTRVGQLPLSPPHLTPVNGRAPYTYTVLNGTLPPGTHIGPPLGQESGFAMLGVPGEVGTFTVTVRITDADGCTAERDVTMTVQPERDVNGDGRADQAVGVPGDAVGGKAGAGAVNLIFGSATGLTPTGNKLVTLATLGPSFVPAAGDAFGSGVATGDFNGDGRADLAVGAPGRSNGAGAVAVFPGASGGVTNAGSVLLTHSSLPGSVAGSPGDAFGAGVATGDVNGDGRADLVIGVPGADVAGAADAGKIAVFLGSPGGINVSSGKIVSLASSGVSGSPLQGARFGTAIDTGYLNDDVAADVVVGGAGEPVSGHPGAGAITVINGSPAGLTGAGSKHVTQATSGVPGSPEDGDGFGSAVAVGGFGGTWHGDVAVGVPGDPVGGLAGAGTVQTFSGTPTGISLTVNRSWSQNSSGIPDAAEAGDRFGAALATGSLGASPKDDLAVAAPGEAIGATPNAGAVHVLFGGLDGLSKAGNQLWQQNTGGVPGAVASGDLFGSSLSALDVGGPPQADLLVGTPHDMAGSVADGGTVTVFLGGPAGPTVLGTQLFSQNTSGIAGTSAAGDMFGAALLP